MKIKVVYYFTPQVHWSGDTTYLITKCVDRLNCTCSTGIRYPIPCESYPSVLNRRHISYLFIFLFSYYCFYFFWSLDSTVDSDRFNLFDMW